MEKVGLKDLGLIDYKKAWDLQEKLNKTNVEIKLNQRKNPDLNLDTKHHLLYCEHPLVYTMGKSGSIDNLLLNEEELADIQAKYYKINRGGDITHHGPGQLVAYPIFDLEKIYTDIHRFLRELEEAIILTLADFSINAGRYPGYTGVWIEPEDDSKARKICAMGIRCSRWITMHGLALNVNNNLSYFENIVPCGIKDKDVTSIELELGHKVNMEEVKERLSHHLEKVFGISLVLGK
ncbi:MAG: lipoyl(octanoyl) transferase LipB [Salibacteraceae bacterium]